MNKTMRQVLFIIVLLATLLAACAPAPAPTPDQDQINSQIATSVALTVASQNLDTAQAQPPATETPLPTATPMPATSTPLPPLDTPTAVQLPTNTASSGGGGGGGSSASSTDYRCDAINRKPFDYAIYKPGDKFDIKWTIVNNGKKALRAGLDLRYSNGDKLMADKVIELPALDPGDEFQVDFDAVAPEKAGNYVMVYMVEGGLCYPYTAITVEK